MGIDGSCKVKLIKKNRGNAVNEFNELAKVANSIFSVTDWGEAKCKVDEKYVEVDITNPNDRSFFYVRSIVPTILKGEVVKSWEDFSWIPDGAKNWESYLSSVCKKHDCMMEFIGDHDSCVSATEYVVIDNDGKFRIDTELSWYDSYGISMPDMSEEAKAEAQKNIDEFNAKRDEGKRIIEEFKAA